MGYSIGEAAKLLNINESTIRYYDKEGLLPFLNRSKSKIRKFNDNDIRYLKLIECMKKANMSIKDIKTYIELSLKGDSTIKERLNLFLKQKELVNKQIEDLKETLNVLEYKCWYYETALKDNTLKNIENIKEEDVPLKYKEVRNKLKNI